MFAGVVIPVESSSEPPQAQRARTAVAIKDPRRALVRMTPPPGKRTIIERRFDYSKYRVALRCRLRCALSARYLPPGRSPDLPTPRERKRGETSGTERPGVRSASAMYS